MSAFGVSRSKSDASIATASSQLPLRGFGAGVSRMSGAVPVALKSHENSATGKPKAKKAEKSQAALSPRVDEIVWRGILKAVRHHYAAGVTKPDGNISNGWGAFQLSPVDQKRLPKDFPADEKVYSKKTWSVSGVFIGDPQVGMEVLCHGVFHQDQKYGEQFKASVLVEPLPDVQDVEHVVQWLTRKTGTSKHRILGMTAVRARKAADHFGMDILAALGDPLRLREIFPEAICQNMSDSFLRESRNYRLHHFFLENGLFQGHVHAVITWLEETRHQIGKAWTVDSVVAQTRKDPYWLTAVSGIGFLVADRVAEALGFAQDHPLRIQAGIRYALEIRENQGHTATRKEELLTVAGGKDVLCIEEMASPLQVSMALRDALAQMLEHPDRHGLLFWELPTENGFDKECWVARAVCAHSERYVARRILNMIQQGENSALLSQLKSSSRPEDGQVALSASQRAALLIACSARIGVLTGGPGTGKTTCLYTVARSARQAHLRVELCAPSGKAASRLKQATGFEGKTIHRLLRLGPNGEAMYNEENPYPADLFIVDESSMVDVYLMQHLLRAVPYGASVLLVGDDQQLPSVGPGRVFGDIIDSGVVPVGRLTENHRQGGASDIAIGASRVISGRLPARVPETWTGEADRLPESLDFFSAQWVQTSRSEETLSTPSILEAIRHDIQSLADKGVPLEHIQILTPQKTGKMGISALNAEMTERLNPLYGHLLQKGSPTDSSPGNPLQALQAALAGSIPTGATFPPCDLPKSCLAPLTLGWMDDQPLLWRVGDRVIQVKNDYGHEVFNGDMGVVIWTEPENENGQKPLVGVYFEQGDLPVLKDALETIQSLQAGKPWVDWTLQDMQDAVEKLPCGDSEGKVIWYEHGQLARLRHAGVLTVHKTQGSEYPYVIMLLHTSHHFMASRPLLYTGMTRAKKGLRLYLAESSAWKAVKNKGQKRDTMLTRRLALSWV